MAAPSRKPATTAQARSLVLSHALSHALGHASSKADEGPSKTRPLSVRLPTDLIEDAKKATGLTSDTELVRAALATLIAPNAFGAWLVANEGALPADFDLGV